MMRCASRAERRPRLEALGERQHVGVAEGGLQLGKRAEGEAEAIGGAVEAGFDLAAVGVVGHWEI